MSRLPLNSSKLKSVAKKTRLVYDRLRAARFSNFNAIPRPHLTLEAGDYLDSERFYFPSKIGIDSMKRHQYGLGYRPKISLIMVIPEEGYQEQQLQDTILSVADQIYTEWELLVYKQGSLSRKLSGLLKYWHYLTRRVYIIDAKSKSLAEIYKHALRKIKGQFFGFIYPGDLLAENALLEIAQCFRDAGPAEVVYTDEDKIDENNVLFDPYFKADWSPESFLSRMYTGQLMLIKKDMLSRVDVKEIFAAEYNPEDFSGAFLYDFLLRLSETKPNIYHLPRVLYHRRDNGRHQVNRLDYLSSSKLVAKIVKKALERRKIKAEVKANKNYSPSCLVNYKPVKESKVSIVIPSKDRPELIGKCLDSIFANTTYKNFEVVVVDNGSADSAVFKLYTSWTKKEPMRFKYISENIPFNFSTLVNRGVDASSGEYVLLLNNDIEITTPEWLERMLAQGQQAKVGCVGALLIYPDGRVQHAGAIMGVVLIAGHSHRFFPEAAEGYFGQIQTVNNYSVVTGACLLCRKDLYVEVGGFEEHLKVAYNDVDFCLKVMEAGYRNVYLPQSKLLHYESISRGQDNTVEKRERWYSEISFMLANWERYLKHDPYYSPNLSRPRFSDSQAYKYLGYREAY